MFKYWSKQLKTENCILNEIYQYKISIKSISSNKRIGPRQFEIFSTILDLNVWLNQYVVIERAFIADATARIPAVFLQESYAFIDTSNKCLIYRYLTDNLCLQLYLSKIIDSSITSSLSLSLCTIRYSAHRLGIETGRYTNTPSIMRSCTYCNATVIEDELNMVLKCHFFSDLRIQFL
jgi:hypothetical protein